MRWIIYIAKRIPISSSGDDSVFESSIVALLSAIAAGAVMAQAFGMLGSAAGGSGEVLRV